jgi:hypothetical protein
MAGKVPSLPASGAVGRRALVAGAGRISSGGDIDFGHQPSLPAPYRNEGNRPGARLPFNLDIDVAAILVAPRAVSRESKGIILQVSLHDGNPFLPVRWLPGFQRGSTGGTPQAGHLGQIAVRYGRHEPLYRTGRRAGGVGRLRAATTA